MALNFLMSGRSSNVKLFEIRYEASSTHKGFSVQRLLVSKTDVLMLTLHVHPLDLIIVILSFEETQMKRPVSPSRARWSFVYHSHLGYPTSTFGLLANQR